MKKYALIYILHKTQHDYESMDSIKDSTMHPSPSYTIRVHLMVMIW